MTVARNHRSVHVVVLALTVAAAGCSHDPEAMKRQYLASGDAYMAKQKYAEASIEYQNAIQQDDHFGEARTKLATAYLRQGNGSKALAESVRAADLMPADADAQLQAANLLILAEQFNDTEDRARNVLERNPKDVRATVALGNALAGLKDLDGAVTQLEEAIRLDPGRSGSYTNLATLQLGAGRLREAEGAYRAAVDKAHVQLDASLLGAREVAFFPPVTGG